MQSEPVIYNTNLAKGTGFVNETLELIALVQEGDTKESFLKRCLEQNPLGKSTHKRNKDLITLLFFDRYWDGNLPKNLQSIRERGIGLDAMKSIFLVYTSRANIILKVVSSDGITSKSYTISFIRPAAPPVTPDEVSGSDT